MSYRLINSNAIAIKYPEVNEMPCVFANLPDGMNGQFIDAQPEPQEGHWIEKDGFDGDTYYDCSVCGNSWTTIDGTPMDNGMNYCPNCGAKMTTSTK